MYECADTRKWRSGNHTILVVCLTTLYVQGFAAWRPAAGVGRQMSMQRMAWTSRAVSLVLEWALVPWADLRGTKSPVVVAPFVTGADVNLRQENNGRPPGPKMTPRVGPRLLQAR